MVMLATQYFRGGGAVAGPDILFFPLYCMQIKRLWQNFFSSENSSKKTTEIFQFTK